ncbi:ABC transporter permease [Embleya hyalina]|uniref:Peptide ABC transporter permease n=1 Tax=Embleya hyalina TaxID=516124 RepID=A0A401YEP5_9ACTN|nr:ABC transporter permease [Embleya hyalina]GCD93060.1 peptide ABC transporter permease [Embleya hyalina]
MKSFTDTRHNPWVTFTLRRLGRLTVSLALLVTASFAMIHLVPGDPVRAALGLSASPELVEAREHALGLDRSLPDQFGSFLTRLLHGDLGESIGAQMPVADVISDRLPSTMQIAAIAFATTIVVAIPLGMAAGVLTRDGRRRRLELAFVGTTSVVAVFPEFLLAVGLVALFGAQLGWLPVALKEGPESYVLPVLALAIGPVAALSRIVRVETLRVLDEDYMRTARAKRLPTRILYLRHALPNLLTSSLTLGGLMLAGLLTGTVLVENVFAWPGLGMTMVQAITQKDYPLVQGIVLVYGTLALLINFAVDVLLAVTDPNSTIRES